MSRPRPTRVLVPSIVRSISWGFWWRRVLAMVCLDLALVISLLMVQTYAAAVRSADVASGIWPLPSSVQLGMRGPELLDLGCHVAVEGGNATFTLGTLLPVLLCALAPLVVTEFFSLVSFFPDMRRVRRQLKPLNDLALKADALVSADTLGAATRGPTASGEDKMASLEQAIERASVDAPRVRTGDKDLESIEVALNRLLRQMQDAKLQQMRFVNDASHELRTPIAVVRGYADMVDRWGKDDQAVLEESIAALKLEGEHMQELVEQLLFLARGDSGRNELHRQPCNVATLVAEIAEESQMIDAGHRYELSSGAEDAAEAQDSRFLLMADAVLVKQALRIIVQNAAKYSPEQTTIGFSLTQDETSVSAGVQDEGRGMSAKTVRHIFERFYRAQDARRDAAGSGLGLSIAKWIADSHGGSISVVSCEGVGSRFVLTIPRGAEHDTDKTEAGRSGAATRARTTISADADRQA